MEPSCKLRVLNADRSQMYFRSRSMTISRENSSEKEFDVVEKQIFNSREFAEALIGWNAVFDRPYDYGLVRWVGVGGNGIQLVVLLRQISAGTRSSTAHTTTVWSRGWEWGWERFVVSKLIIFLRQPLVSAGTRSSTAHTTTVWLAH
jgi:hypothetical protein